MSEYWKSTPKYWCKHCTTYVKDTPFERKQHENTGKHQGNLKRFLRGIQNDHEKGEREKERAKAEVDRLNRVVGGASTTAGPSTVTPSTIRKSASSSITANDQKRQWAQLAEMGIQVPDDYRAEMAMPGQWQTTKEHIGEAAASAESLVTGVRKRKLDGQEEDEEESLVRGPRRGWGTTSKQYPDRNDSDLDALLKETIVNKQTSTTQLKEDPEDHLLVEPGPNIESSAPDVSSRQPIDEIQKAAGPVESVSLTAPIVTKSEDVGLERQTAFTDTLKDTAIPVFKKRKVKLKAENKAD